MRVIQNKERGLLAKLIEKCLEIYIRKECNEIGKINIIIISSTINLIKGLIKKIFISAKNVNYKGLLFDEIELESNQANIGYKISNKQLKFNSNIKLNIKIILSSNSLKEVLVSKDWSWVGDMISEKILNIYKLDNLKIDKGKVQINGIDKDTYLINSESIRIKAKEGKIFIEDHISEKHIIIPIEDKLYISRIDIQDKEIIINANSSISF
tara:strand:+ start:741 stop:1373 length:633 start_codon:yes stop_codon:yes gene_type:complete